MSPVRNARLMFLSIVLVAACAGPETADEKTAARGEVREMASNTLSRLYQVQPSAKPAIEGAAGYAVFSNFGLKIFVAGGGSGEGVAVNNKTRQETFMKMVEVQAGLGFGGKKFSLVWLFENEAALNSFTNSGWEFGGQATAAAKTGDTGAAMQGAIPVSPGVWIYQLTDTGLALELTAKGTKYYRDSALN